MTLEEILKSKGSIVYTIEPDATLEQVVAKLVEHNIGSLLVCERHVAEGEKVVGIITERDILHACASRNQPLASTSAAEAMSTTLITGSPSEAVEEVMGLMTTNHIRHMPVLSEGRLVGMVSIGDVVKAQHDHLAMENQAMKDYIQS